MNDPSMSIQARLRASGVAMIAAISMIVLPAVCARSQNESTAFERQQQLWRSQLEDLDPQQRLKVARREYERRRRQEARRQLVQADVAEPAWRSLGPTNGAGRMTAIAPHPTVSGTLYAGAEVGGVWKTTDAASTWVPLTDSIGNLEVGALAVAPSNPAIIYLGTGTGVNYVPIPYGRGIGLLKSTDGGANWQFANTIVATVFFSISVHPTNPNDLLIGTYQGGFRSTDGGQSFTEVIPRRSGEFVLNVNDIARDPGNPQTIYATAYSYGISPPRVVKSTDGGASWTEKSPVLPTQGLQIALALDPSNPQVLYASTATNEPNDRVSRIFKTADGGNSWVELTGLSGNSDYNISHFLGQDVWRHNSITVSPGHANTILAGGVNYVRSTDGGATWHIPRFYNTPIHAGATQMRYQGPTLYVANGGGVWSTDDDGDTGTDRNTTLVTRQYFALANDPILLSRIYAGSQENGTDRRPDSGTPWSHLFLAGWNSDGFDAAVNPNAPSTAYATTAFGQIYRTSNAATVIPSFNNITPPGLLPIFFTRLTMDPNNPSVLYTIDRVVWRTTDGGNSWARLPTTMTDGSTWDPDGYSTNSIAVAPGNGAIIMASKSGIVVRSTNGGVSWVTTLISQVGEVKNMEFDPANANVVYVTTPSYDGLQFTGKLYVTTDGGMTWAQRGAGLPQAALNVVRVDPLDSNILYCGTDIGVYRSTDRGLTWSSVGASLPAVPVTDLRITADGGTLRAATFGRGVWELPIRPVAEAGINGSVTSPEAAGIANVSLILTVNGNQVISQATDANGASHFGPLAPGVTYTVTPYKDGYVFSPPSQTFANLDGVQAAHFTGVASSDAPTALSVYSTDLDGDGKCDLGFYRSGLWGWLNSSQSYRTDNSRFFSWGGSNLRPLSADFDGDGKSDLAYIVPSSGGQSATYAILLSSRNYSFAAGDPLFVPAGFPSIGDTPVVGDVDGDGKADPGIWRASQGIWIIPKSSSNYTQYIFAQWGQLGDVPVIADFDHDGKADIGFYRDGLWGMLKSTASYNTNDPQFFSWGGSGLQPITGDFDGDGRADIGYMVPPANGQSAAYAILLSSRSYSFAAGQPLFLSAGYPSIGDTPVVGDFDGDGKADPGIWRASQGVWIIPKSSSNYTQYIFSQWGQSGDIAFPNSTGRH